MTRLQTTCPLCETPIEVPACRVAVEDRRVGPVEGRHWVWWFACPECGHVQSRLVFDGKLAFRMALYATPVDGVDAALQRLERWGSGRRLRAV